MNHEEAWALLGDYIDRDLPEAKRRDVDRHLRECETCRREVDELRAIVDRAGVLPRGIEPERDLWPAIAARTAARESSGMVPDAGFAGRIGRFFGEWRGLRPAAAIAAVALVVVLVAVGLRGPGRPGSLSTPPGGEERASSEFAVDAVLAALDMEAEEGDRELEEIASETRDDPFRFPVIGLVIENVRIIDRTIAELREAWKDDPDSPRAARMLAAAYRAKLSLQARASRVAAET
jgi:anti-sigma factor RsiW